MQGQRCKKLQKIAKNKRHLATRGMKYLERRNLVSYVLHSCRSKYLQKPLSCPNFLQIVTCTSKVAKFNSQNSTATCANVIRQKNYGTGYIGVKYGFNYYLPNHPDMHLKFQNSFKTHFVIHKKKKIENVPFPPAANPAQIFVPSTFTDLKDLNFSWHTESGTIGS